MLNRKISIIIILGILLFLTVPALADEDKGILLWRIEAKKGVNKGECESVTGILEGEVARYSGHKVISESDILTVLKGEEVKQMCSDEEGSCLAELGNAMGVPEAVSGNLGRVGSVWVINIKRIDVRKIEVIRRVSHQFDGDLGSLVRILPELTAELFDKKVEKPEAVIPPATIDAGKHATGKTPYKTDSSALVGKKRKDEGPKIKLAVLNLIPMGVKKGTAMLLTSAVVTELHRVGIFDIISKEEIGRLVEHMEDKQLLGCEEAECAVEIGAAVKADKLVTGSVGKVEKTLLINLQLIDVKKGKVDNRVERQIPKKKKAAMQETKGAAKQLISKILKERSGQLVIKCSQEGADVHVNDYLIGTTPLEAYELPGGWHNVRISKKEFITWGKDVRIDARDRAEVDVRLTPSGEMIRAYRKKHRTYRILAWTFTGIGAAALGSAVGLHVWNDDRYYDEYEPRKKAYNSNPGGAKPGERDELGSMGASIRNVGYVWGSLYALAGVSGGLSLFFFLYGEDPEAYDDLMVTSGEESQAFDFRIGIDPQTGAAGFGCGFEF